MILTRADEILARDGYAGFTIDRLAGEIGIAKGTVYLSFPSKEAIALAVAARVFYAVLGKLDEIAGSQTAARSRLRRMILTRVLLRHKLLRHYHGRQAEMLAPIRPALQELRVKHGDEEAAIFARVIADGIGARAIRSCRPLPTARAILRATESLLPSNVTSEEISNPAAIRRSASHVATLLLEGLNRSSRKKARSIPPSLLMIFGFLATLPFAPIAAQVSQTAVPLDSIFAKYATSQSPGCAIGISQGETVQRTAAFGMASLELGVRNTPETVFHAGSIGKQFTAMATLLLARDRKLSLEDYARKYVPELGEYASAVTIRQLLAHTSGVRDQGELLWIAGGLDDIRFTRDDMLSLLSSQRTLNFAPGAQFLYGGTEYDLLALIVERVSGKPFTEFVRDRIFAPLKMTHTHFRDDAGSIIPHRAMGYRPQGSDWRMGIYASDVVGGGGLFTTVGDLLLWEANLDKPVVGDSTIVQTMQTEVRPGGTPSGFGLGLTVGTFRGLTAIGHEGRDFGYQSDVVRFPQKQLAIAVLCNARDIDAYTLGREVARRMLPEPVVQSPSQTASRDTLRPVTVDPSLLSEYAGLYFHRGNMALRRVEVRDGKLVWARGAGTKLIPLSATDFQFENQPLRIRFERVAGTIARVTVFQAGQTPRIYERKQPLSSRLSDYAGTYIANEIEATYRVTADTTSLVIRANPNFTIRARPLFEDMFEIADGILLEFTRGAKGKVTHLRMSTTRARNVGFSRMP